ncbi:unnamed protein product [Sphenostylis stenocarpa]|uniref:Uncharacterized protein n=1 Tax=Sphenostylis stenocarpa TaxID=92480 RepID=A0AA86T1H5_9FABA|nr:unnamed protein product [Sphenostylis stenocarpa]
MLLPHVPFGFEYLHKSQNETLSRASSTTCKTPQFPLLTQNILEILGLSVPNLFLFQKKKLYPLGDSIIITQLLPKELVLVFDLYGVGLRKAFEAPNLVKELNLKRPGNAILVILRSLDTYPIE